MSFSTLIIFFKTVVLMPLGEVISISKLYCPGSNCDVSSLGTIIFIFPSLSKTLISSSLPPETLELAFLMECFSFLISHLIS